MSLDSTKKRISSVKTTSKITNAMKLVASSKIAKQKAVYLKIKDYYEEYYDIVGKIVSLSPEFAKTSENQKTLYIVITSTLGLCGGYNSSVAKACLAEMKEDDFVLQLGTKGREYFKNNLRNDQIIKFDINVANVDYEKCAIIASYVLDLFTNQKKFDCIKLVYTKFVNAITFVPTIISLIPFDKKITDAKQSLNENNFDFEPKKEIIIKEILHNYLSSIIYGSMIESSISESASRRNAMDTATNNANDLILNLQLLYNRMRQAKITNEITEIVAGSEEN